ncbi:LuxR family transcriptional regulator [Lentzea sp. NBRC 105346]|nr:LuxR family transcriptional regulator [Lentzea sp. NBRC 105346]
MREQTGFADRVSDLARGRGGAVLVEGDPGIGKTTLVKTISTDAPVCWGAGDELGRVLPLQPLVDALRTSRAELFGAQGGAAGSDLVAAAAEHVIELVEKRCADGPLVLVIDDLQWADGATVAVWRRLSDMVAQLPLLLVGAMRPVPHRDDLVALRRTGVDRIRLGALPARAVAELFGLILGGVPDDRLRKLAAGAGGNPLYLVELSEALVRGNCVEVIDGKARLISDRVPDSLNAAIADRIGFVSADTRSVLTAAALLGVDFEVSDLAVVLRSRVADLVPALQEATHAGVLVDGGSVLSFRHGLVRTALHEELPQAARSAWHLEAARELAEAGAGNERVVRQLLAGTEVADWVVPWLIEHGESLVSHAPHAAIELLGRVVDGPDAQPRREELLSLLADAYFRVGEHERAEECAVSGLHVATEAPTDLYWTLAQCRSLTGRSAEALTDLHKAAAGATGRDLARLLVLTARAHWDLGDFDEAETVARQAFGEATACGDRGSISWALHVRAIVAMMRSELHSALPLLDEALAVASSDDGTGDLRLLLQINRALVLGDLDRRTEAVEAARAVRQAADDAGNLVRLAQAQSLLGQLLLHAGDWDDALVDVDLLGDDVKNPIVSACDHGVAALIHLHRGDATAARRHLDSVGTNGIVIISVALARSLFLEQEGDLAGALDALRPGLTDDAVIEDLLPDAVRLAVQVGDRELAEHAVGQAEALLAKLDVPHRQAAVLQCRALLDGSPEGLLEAADRYQEAGLPERMARALSSAAVLFADQGDPASARAALTRAVETYTALGAESDTLALAARMREHGIRRGPQVKHRRAHHGWDSLTPAEQRVTELVVQGLSNQQIGEQLFLSRRTVSTHVSHVLAKLGVRSRTDITREAVRRGVMPS